jgi:hypothetical protein
MRKANLRIQTRAKNGWVPLFAAGLFASLACGFAEGQEHGRPIPGHYIVVLKQGVAPGAVVREHGISARFVYDHALNGFAGEVPAGRLLALQNDPRVESVEADLPLIPCSQTTPAGIKRIGTLNSDVAKINGVDERVDVDVAIIDSGIDRTHPDLNVVQGVSFVDTSNGQDVWGHGTHVAGIVGALDNTIGVVGVAPGARLWAVKVLDNSGNGTVSALIQGIDYVTQNAAQIEVANISMVTYGKMDALRTAIQNCVARGVVVVGAAGDLGATDVYGADGVFNTSDDVIPAAYPEVMTVSAMVDTDGTAGGLGPLSGLQADDTLGTFSCYSASVVAGNPVTSPGRAIDVAAPGRDVLSTYPVGSIYGAYVTLSGTSMAAGHVSGAVALYVAANGRASNAVDVARIRQAMIDAAEPQTTWGPADTRDRDTNHEGMVRVIASAASAPPLTVPALNMIRSGQNCGISFMTAVGRVYTVEFKNSLLETNWTALPSFSGDGTLKTIIDTNSASLSCRFYRTRVQ